MNRSWQRSVGCLLAELCLAFALSAGATDVVKPFQSEADHRVIFRFGPAAESLPERLVPAATTSWQAAVE